MNFFKKTIMILLISISFLNVSFSEDSNLNADGIKWYHDSAEKKALYVQAYNMATQKISIEVATQKLKKGDWGVILDIDETVLDNFWLKSGDYKNYKFSEDSLKKMRAIATPLAAKFTHFVHNLGGYVSFITNRDATSKKVIEATVRNLEKEHIYFDQVVFSNVEAKNPSDKNSRFEAVESGKYGDDIVLAGKLPAHKILAYLGDNIQDFPNLNQKDMAKAKDTAFEDFGNRYFIMPNPIYGSWS